MQFGLFGSAAARRGSPEFDSSEGFRDFIDYNIEAEALGFHSTFVVEYHFTGYGQVSATLTLLTWLGARTRRMHPEYPRRVRLGAFADHGPFELCKAPGHLRVIAS